MPSPTSNPDLWPFDLETGMWVASKVGNLPSKFGHARPLGSRIIHYVRDRQRDGWTDTSNTYCPMGGGIIIERTCREVRWCSWSRLWREGCRCSELRRRHDDLLPSAATHTQQLPGEPTRTQASSSSLSSSSPSLSSSSYVYSQLLNSK